MKRDDEFSKGLAGFIDEKLSGKHHIKVTRSDKVGELKSMIRELINKADESKTQGLSINFYICCFYLCENYAFL